MRLFSGQLSGASQVPPVTTNSNGFAQAQLARDLGRLQLFINVFGIDHNGTLTPGNAADNMSGFHIHSGAAGVNGGVVFDIQSDPQTQYNNTSSQPAFFAQSDWTAAEGLNATQIAALAAGNLYVNIHTTTNGGGEIRGQLIEEPGGSADRIDVSALGISNMGDLSFILFDIGGVAQLLSTYDGQLSTLVLQNITVGSLTASDFIFGGLGNETVDGTGNADQLFGGDGSDILNGLGGNDSLYGGAGTDLLTGGLGNDHYVVDTFLDGIVENPGGGIDDVLSFESYIMHANVENVQLAGSGNFGVSGNDENNQILGNTGNNGVTGGLGNDTISGNAGNDTIDGGFGADQMDGGTGSDVFFVDNLGDSVADVDEASVYDIIWTIVSLTLPQDVEILILNGGTVVINGTGNAGLSGNAPNLMLGNNAANVLTTFGGDDIILGLDGNDTISTGIGSALGVEIISGGNGLDTLSSGGGHDYFTYANISEAGDTITDFVQVGGNDLDIFDLRPLRPTFLNAGGLTTVGDLITSGHLTYAQAGANTQVSVDIDGTVGGASSVLLATLNNTTAATVQILTLV